MLTDIIMIIDKSGSMGHLTKETIDGFNNFIEEQKNLDGRARVTTILFNQFVTPLYVAEDIKAIKPLTIQEYLPSGYTALLDAIGMTINNYSDKLRDMKLENKPDKVIFVIITDGQENSSRTFSYREIKNMVENQKTFFNWEFNFYGANIDSFTVGGMLGINNNVNYVSDAYGTQSLYSDISRSVTKSRTGDKGSVS